MLGPTAEESQEALKVLQAAAERGAGDGPAVHGGQVPRHRRCPGAYTRPLSSST
jgi:hypothetical protein